MSVDKLINHLEEFFAPQAEEGLSLLASVSGGLDSTVLLELLWLWQERSSLPLKLKAFHYTHNIRPGTQGRAEAQGVAAFCGQRGIPLIQEGAAEGEILSYSQEENLSLEEAARLFRYRALKESLVKEELSMRAVTAHHRNDQIETLVMRFFQGAGLAGSRGIPAEGGQILRPLLEVTRHELEAVARQRKLTWFEDPSNAESRYLRNRIRHELIPSLHEIFPGFEESLLRAREDAEDIWSALTRGQKGDGVRLLREAQEGDFSYEGWLRSSPWHQKEALYRLWSGHAKRNKRGMKLTGTLRIPHAQIREAREQLKRRSRDLRFETPWGIMSGDGERVKMGNILASPEEKGYVIHIEDQRPFSLSGDGDSLYSIEESLNDEATSSTKKKGVVTFYGYPPFTLRTELPGDAFPRKRGKAKPSAVLCDSLGRLVLRITWDLSHQRIICQSNPSLQPEGPRYQIREKRTYGQQRKPAQQR